jgi:predicted RNA-binding Zn-ribbon protein involved in translation (DUF1610 family)
MWNRDFIRGAKASAAVASTYNSSTSHPFRLEDCILGKLNLRERPPRKNKLAIARCSTCSLRIEPIPMLLWCPICTERHIDTGEFATRPHHTHACQSCGMVWRPAVVPTVGVLFLPGFKNDPTERKVCP